MFFQVERAPSEGGQRVPPPEYPRCKDCGNIADGYVGGTPYCYVHRPVSPVVFH